MNKKHNKIKNLITVVCILTCMSIIQTSFCNNISLNKSTYSDIAKNNKNYDDLYSKQWALKNNGTLKVDIDNLKKTKAILLEDFKLKEDKYVDVLSATKGIDIKYEEARKLFDNYKDKKDVLVAIIDTGIDINHYEIKDSIFINENEIPNNGIDDDKNGFIDDYNGWNFVNNNNEVFVDEVGDAHGTHAAGTIAAKHNNGGIKGIAYDEHIKILPIRIIEKDLSGRSSNLIKAIDYALKFNADVINISLGTRTYDDNLATVIREHPNTMFVIASGNTYGGMDIDDVKIYPASFQYANVITVSNMCFNGDKFLNSNYGRETVTIFAPGTFILSTLPNNKFGYLSGTSVASPVVTAAVAMIKSINKKLPAMDIKNLIINNAIDVDELKNRCEAKGYLDLYSILFVLTDGGLR